MVTKRNIDIIQNIIGDDNISRIDNMINYFKKIKISNSKYLFVK